MMKITFCTPDVANNFRDQYKTKYSPELGQYVYTEDNKELTVDFVNIFDIPGLYNIISRIPYFPESPEFDNELAYILNNKARLTFSYLMKYILNAYDGGDVYFIIEDDLGYIIAEFIDHYIYGLFYFGTNIILEKEYKENLATIDNNGLVNTDNILMIRNLVYSSLEDPNLSNNITQEFKNGLIINGR